jgi:ribosome-binding protein aMBF1 (putative translation factor)
MKLKSHTQLKKEVFAKRPSAKKAYDALEFEFAILDAIITARNKKGMTQKILAEKIGTKQSAIARFEAGQSNPTLSFIQKVSTALGVKIHVTA